MSQMRESIVSINEKMDELRVTDWTENQKETYETLANHLNEWGTIILDAIKSESLASDIDVTVNASTFYAELQAFEDIETILTSSLQSESNITIFVHNVVERLEHGNE